jgi:1-phosphofructokinase/tagatose 6-phosphate kinase
MTGEGIGKKSYLCVCLNPVVQKTLVFKGLAKDEVNRAVEHRVDASGKGVNVTRILTQTGRRAVHLTQAGGPTRKWFLSLCAADGLDLRWVESGSDIRFCYTLIDAADRSATELVEEAKPVSSDTGERILAEFDRTLGECGALIISGTKAAGFPDDIFPEMSRRAREAGLLVVLDIKGQDLVNSLPSRPDIVKPNLHELLATWPFAADGLSFPGAGEESAGPSEAVVKAHVASIAAELHARWESRLVVTRGSRATWFWDGSALCEEPVVPRVQINPTGSGDAFTAALAATLAEGGGLREAVREGNRLGGLNAERLKPGSIV